MDTTLKILRFAAAALLAVAVAVSAVVSIYAGCHVLLSRVTADFHYRRAGRRRGTFRVMEFGWHMRRGESRPIPVVSRGA